MTRRPERIVEAMAAVARLTPFDDETPWYDVLFTRPDDEERDVLARPEQPDQALLSVLAHEYTALDRHAATLSARTHVAWLEQLLGIPRLPALPDRVIAHITVEPGLAPAVVPRGTLLRGGKDAFGNERHYATLDTLTAHGAPLIAVRTLHPGGTEPGRPGIANEAPDFPLAPFTGPDAVHTLRVYSPALSFEGGDLTAELTFGDGIGVHLLSPAVWRCSTADGGVGPTTTGTVSGTTVTVTLSNGCGAPAGQTPWIECVVPATVPVPEELAFVTVEVAVTGRTPFAPQAAFHNDGAVDVTKEFQPFGAVAKRGDAFYLRSDEAFSKALRQLTVTVSLMQAAGGILSASAGGSGIPAVTADFLRERLSTVQAEVGAAHTKHFGAIFDFLADRGDPTVVWQRRVEGQWRQIGDAGDRFGTVSADVSGALGSEPFAVAGQPGHYVRAFLSEGDFGWTGYQEDIAAFASRAVAGTTPKPTMPTPPVPPVASGVTISYTTTPVAATRVESRSGWRHTVQQDGGVFRPFRRAVSDTVATGMVAIGLDLPASAAGSSVSLYFDIASAAPCGAADRVSARWEWWDGTIWHDLPVADGSRQLRESGLLRFVVPAGSVTGCADLGAAAGRWIRLVTTAPERLGTIQGVHVDAVQAEFVSAAPDPGADPSTAGLLPPGTIKGTLSPLRGVRKVTNLASLPGRGPEPDPAYRARASARTRHRDRAVLPWDYEQQVAQAFPEVAAVRCLPHTDRDGARKGGKVALVVLPDRPSDPAPRPSVSLAANIMDAVAPARPLGAEVAVVCPRYAPVTVVATIALRRGIDALSGKESITAALESVLHPGSTLPTRWGQSLYASTLIAFLERRPDIDVVTSFQLRDAEGTPVEAVEVDRCRGLYCSSGAHVLTCEEQL
ncbi:baseplate J/gp47 family protein [Streptomyces sp. P17]|uniref:baseplate J/gp47 family protein n=1 Tax=Streptomyces sp. P17 TaxID=3074716 RepID=UPI0028F3EE4C|nr:baseplate J/gp47 family protein [Streptomyces sp. P17]MDT9694961.1 baseplate J/gp47 family protein [Streptomyces sp. P17]